MKKKSGIGDSSLSQCRLDSQRPLHTEASGELLINKANSPQTAQKQDHGSTFRVNTILCVSLLWLVHKNRLLKRRGHKSHSG